MGVMLKGLPPGMQHGDNAELGTEMAGVGTDDDTVCDASVFFACTGLNVFAKGKTPRTTERL